MGCGSNSKTKENHKYNSSDLENEKNLSQKILNLENKGILIKNYKIVEKIGKGCFGKVYRVIHLETGQERAVKVVKKEYLNLQDDNKKFLKEIEVLSKIDHPNIIKIFEYFVTDDSYYVVVELAKGCELMVHLEKLFRYSEKEAAVLMEQILSCVTYLHSKGIVHRDLKPENIMMESLSIGELNIKLIDFGSAYCISKKSGQKIKLKIGTPYYMAPEVIKGNYDNKCDLWACGVIMYILLSGEPPFFGVDDVDTFELIKIGQYSLKDQQWDNISTEAKDLIKKLLTMDPKNRISAEEAVKDPWIMNYKSNKNEKVNLSIKNKLVKFSSTQKLQQAILSYLVHNFSSREYSNELRILFKNLDTSADGKLSFDELKVGFNKYFTGYKLNDDELLELYQSMDTDNSNSVEFEEFLSSFVNKEYMLTENNLNLAFSHFDKDNSGKLSSNEIKNLLGVVKNDEHGNKFVLDIIKEVDRNGDGEISLEEFKDLMKKIVTLSKKI